MEEIKKVGYYQSNILIKMVSLLISLLVFAVIVYVVYLLLGMVVGKLPPVAQQIIWIIAALIAVIYLLNILGIGGGHLGNLNLR